MGTGPGRDPSEATLQPDGGFEGLLEAKRAPMVRLATLLVGSPAIVEEVVQRSFASVNERWAQLDRPDAYLRTSVVNGCAGILRRRSLEQRYRIARIEVVDSEIPEQLIDLRRALDRLPDRQRLVVVLRYFADLPDEEIAEALSAADQPDGKCPIGWLANDILVTANSDFLEVNPAAKLLFTAVRLTALEVSLATETLRRTGADPDDVAAQWIADNRDRVDSWLAAAREAA